MSRFSRCFYMESPIGKCLWLQDNNYFRPRIVLQKSQICGLSERPWKIFGSASQLSLILFMVTILAGHQLTLYHPDHSHHPLPHTQRAVSYGQDQDRTGQRGDTCFVHVLCTSTKSPKYLSLCLPIIRVKYTSVLPLAHIFYMHIQTIPFKTRRVGPVENRPSTNLPHQFVKKKIPHTGDKECLYWWG